MRLELRGSPWLERQDNSDLGRNRCSNERRGGSFGVTVVTKVLTRSPNEDSRQCEPLMLILTNRSRLHTLCSPRPPTRPG